MNSTNDNSTLDPSVTPPTSSDNNTQNPSTENASIGSSNNVSDSPPTTVSQSTNHTTSTPGPNDPCKDNPCGNFASCIKLHSTFFCLCPQGYHYTSKECKKGKIFPGEITVKLSETSGLDDKNSQNYEELYNKTTAFFADALNGTDYEQTIIVKVRYIVTRTARSLLRATTGAVQVSVINIFPYNTTQNESSVSDRIASATNNSEEFSDYRDLNCAANCNERNNQQCIKDNNGIAQCVCLPGYKDVGNGNCQECPFGYRGENCEDQFQLILTIVGTIAAILILSLVIALIISAKSQNKNKKTEEQHLIDNDFQNLRLQQTGFSNEGAEGSIFPKVRTSAPRDGPAPNPYINQRGIPHPDY
ncbi:mucin-13 [Perognathus longimembris pacificus]|uniref:mucin-13 n=1 Tax=Perognathus longimembris pacificus TaxID=214514 RepID=UPI0020184D01|nr:mucin-13 [Perognathus longimembris pacificus]